MDSWPAILYGDERTVKKSLRAFVKKAFKAGAWEAVCSDLEMKTDDGSQDLLLEACHRPPALAGSPLFIPATEPRWRFYLIADALGAAYETKTISRDQYVQMTISGMDNLWFTVGMLHESIDIPSYMPVTTIGYTIASCKLLAQLVSWIPDLSRLDHRLFSYWIYCKRIFDDSILERAKQQSDPKILEGWLRNQLSYAAPNWARAILGLACGAGWEYSWDRVYRTYQGDIVRLFLDDQVIEPVGNGYKVTESFSSKVREIA